MFLTLTQTDGKPVTMFFGSGGYVTIIECRGGTRIEKENNLQPTTIVVLEGALTIASMLGSTTVAFKDVEALPAAAVAARPMALPGFSLPIGQERHGSSGITLESALELLRKTKGGYPVFYQENQKIIKWLYNHKMIKTFNDQRKKEGL